MKNYKILSIEESKNIEFELLSSFDTFCDNNNLKYYLAYGTLLGSIRHKDFIPWDDDIDILMPRPDYEKLIILTKEKGISDIYDTVLYTGTKTKSIYPFVKIIDNTTLVFEKGKSKKNTTGIWIDIFPIDGYPDDNQLGEKMFQEHLKYRHLQDIITTNPFTKKQSFIKKIIKSILIPFISLYGLKNLCRKMDKVSKTYDFNTHNLCTNVLWSEEVIPVYTKSDFEPYKLGEFRGKTFRIPNNWDKILREYYGDYMQLPPENERIPHEFIAYKKID